MVIRATSAFHLATSLVAGMALQADHNEQTPAKGILCQKAEKIVRKAIAKSLLSSITRIDSEAGREVKALSIDDSAGFLEKLFLANEEIED